METFWVSLMGLVLFVFLSMWRSRALDAEEQCKLLSEQINELRKARP
jgi:hypothetical protein